MASFSPFSAIPAAAAAAMQEFQLWERGGVAAAAQSRNLYIAKKSVGYRPPPGVVGDVHQAGPMASRGVGDKGGRLFFGESGGQGHGSLKQWSRIFSF